MIDILSLIAKYPAVTLVLALGTSTTSTLAAAQAHDNGKHESSAAPIIIHEPGPTITDTATVTSSPSSLPSPSELPFPTSTVTVVTTPTIILTSSPTGLPTTSSPPPSISATPTPSTKNHANGLTCFITVTKDHGIVIKVPCPKEK